MSKDLTFDQFSEYLSKVAPQVEHSLTNTIKLCCEKVRSDIQYSMAHTERNTDVSYYTNNKTKAHHPSLPGNPPAPDTGNLRNSIRYEVHDEGSEVYGIVGSTQKDPDYAVYTEYGTTKMAPRPWLRPSMQKNNEWIRKSIANAVVLGLKGQLPQTGDEV
jgi:HK97 gp10 family phage protein